jgi:nucleotide-binding universal stress UspA family protein
MTRSGPWISGEIRDDAIDPASDGGGTARRGDPVRPPAIEIMRPLVPRAEPSYRTILVATDFSENAATALGWAARIGRASHARLAIIHAIDADDGESIPLALRDEVTRRLASITNAAEAMGLTVETEFRVGKPWRIVVEAETRLGAELVVIGTRGQTSYPRLLVGSTTDRVVRAARGPVLAVHPEDAREEAAIETVLVAVDFSGPSSQVGETAARLLLALHRSGRLILLHACHAPVVYDGIAIGAVMASELAEMQDRARHLLDELAASLRGSSLSVETIVRVGDPGTVVEEVARECGAQLIAMGAHGRSSREQLELGSIADRVIHHAPCPVLVCHPEPSKTTVEQPMAVGG